MAKANLCRRDKQEALLHLKLEKRRQRELNATYNKLDKIIEVQDCINQSKSDREIIKALKAAKCVLSTANTKQMKEVDRVMDQYDDARQDQNEIADRITAPAGGLNDCDVEAEYEALEKSLKDEGVEESKGDDATTTLPAFPNVPTTLPVALPPPAPGTKAAKSCAA